MTNLFGVKKYSLEVYDFYHNSIAELCDNSRTSAYGVTVDKKVNGISTLKFNIPSSSPKLKHLVNDGCMIKFDEHYYLIKNQNEIRESDAICTVECEGIEVGLAGFKCIKTNLIAKTARELFETILNESNWVFAGSDIPDNILRHFSCDGESLSVLEAIYTIAENFNATVEFGTNSGNRHYVYLRKEIIDNGFYISSKFNLKSLEINRDSKELCTICRVYGGISDDTGNRINIMSVNPTGKDYIENYQFYLDMGYDIEYIKSRKEYFHKEITINYDLITDVNELYEIAKEQSKKYAYPKIDCNVTFLDLYEMDNRFELDKLVLGERVHVYQFDPIHNTEFVAEAQITGISKNYDDPYMSNIEISNTIVYNDSLNKILNNSDKVDRVLGNSSVIHGMYIKEATIDTLHCKDAFITTAKIKDLAVTSAKIAQAAINTGHIQDAAINNAKIANASIDDAKILNLSANKLTAGTINTADVKVMSAEGEVEISGYQILVKDTSSDMLNPYVRVILGKYRKPNAPPTIEGQEDSEDNYEYGLVIRGKDGKTVMWDSNGVHNAGITDGAVNNNKISDDANISGGKIDIGSIIRIINDDGVSEKINAMQILIDGKNLHTQFTEMSTTIDGQKKTISQMQSDIKQNADSIKLSVESIEKVEEIVDILGTDVKIVIERNPVYKLVGKIYKNKKDITNTIPSHWFFWKRQSSNAQADNEWNVNVGTGIREVVVNDDKYNRNAEFTLIIDNGL